jgi:hypothetical protein
MTRHHHGPGRAHPSRAATLSLMRLSAAARLAGAAAAVAVLWLAVWWAIGTGTG